MNVRKRSGKVVPFDPGFISRAISLAAAAAGEHDEEAAARITEAVTEKLRARRNVPEARRRKGFCPGNF